MRFILILFLLAGCSSANDETATMPSGAGGAGGVGGGAGSAGNAGAGGAEPDACSADADCAPGSVCDAGTAVCRPACASGGACPSGYECAAGGFCVELTSCEGGECPGNQVCDCENVCRSAPEMPCQGDLQCAVSAYCDLCLGGCRERSGQCGSCIDDSGCDPRSVCVQSRAGEMSLGGFCARVCQEGCDIVGPGYQCDEVRAGTTACVPSSGSCDEVNECMNDTECPPGRFCNERLVCQPACEDDTGCPNGRLCDGLRCVPPCMSDGDCAEPALCGADGHCRVPNGCTTSMDCGEPATYCERDSAMCVPGCQVDTDCQDGNLTCLNGQCRPRGCSGNFQCAGGQICNLMTSQCEDAPGRHCEPDCDPMNETSCGDTGQRCLSLQDEDENPLGDFCFEPCMAAPNECPQGYDCVELMGESGMPMGALCIRSCHLDTLN